MPCTTDRRARRHPDGMPQLSCFGARRTGVLYAVRRSARELRPWVRSGSRRCLLCMRRLEPIDCPNVRCVRRRSARDPATPGVFPPKARPAPSRRVVGCRRHHRDCSGGFYWLVAAPGTSACSKIRARHFWRNEVRQLDRDRPEHAVLAFRRDGSGAQRGLIA